MSRLNTYIESCKQIEPIEIGLLVRASDQLRSDLGDLSELCASIGEKGLIQPIVVRPRGSRFEIICGNRRFEACRRLMKRHVECIVRDLSDQDAFEISIIENIQRNTLSVIEEAKAFQKYVSQHGWGGVSQLARKIGKSQEFVSHRIALLDLPSKVLMKVSDNEISASQAQELVWVKNQSSRDLLFETMEREKLSIAELRRMKSELELGARGDSDKDYYTPQFESREIEGSHSRFQLESDSSEKKDKKVLEEAILVLRIALIRIDAVIPKAGSGKLRRVLMKERFNLHAQIDSLIRVKMEMPSPN
ncbi:MAG: ParB/RepB/Spo0J family partition protein [Thaumarchaeota archaeon]|nr:ParB/RepB/Spo0J family partition protein [Nitrososphaerota archaeon]